MLYNLDKDLYHALTWGRPMRQLLGWLRGFVNEPWYADAFDKWRRHVQGFETLSDLVRDREPPSPSGSADAHGASRQPSFPEMRSSDDHDNKTPSSSARAVGYPLRCKCNSRPVPVRKSPMRRRKTPSRVVLPCTRSSRRIRCRPGRSS